MKMKSACALVVLLSLGSVFAADTWYVDDDNYGKEGMDGTTPATAYGVIQQAVDAAHAGDTILVLPGTYDCTTDTNGNCAVINIPNAARYENLTIRSTGGRDVTFIVGRPAPGDNPQGTGCLGGVICAYTASGAAIIDGFTFRDCYGRSGTMKGRGSACHGHTSKLEALHVYNCRAVHCAGAPFCGLVVHSTIAEETFFPSTNDWEYASTFSHLKADNCLVTRMPGRAIAHNSYLVNCTLVGNVSDVINGINTGIYGFHNSIISQTINSEIGVIPCSNTVSSAWINPAKSYNSSGYVPATNIFACVDGFSDYRLRSDSVAVGLADGAALTACVPLVSADRDPADEPGRYSAYHDVYGNAIDITRPFNAGAIQETVAVDDSAFAVTWFKQAYKEPFVIDGETFIGAEAFVRTASASPMQWCVTTAEPETKPLSAVQDSLANLYRMAGSNGTVWVTSAPIGGSRTFSVETAQKIFYMDPAGNDAWDGLSSVHEEGTTTGPWQTFTNAAARLEAETTNRWMLVRCAAGTYDKGESKHARIPISTSKTSRFYHFVGVEGADRTFVVGAEATTGDLDSNGCGTNAVGIIYNTGATVGFTGFTFAGGRSDTGQGTGRDAERAAFSVIRTSASSKARLNLCESVITNNLSSYNYVGRTESGSYNPVFERCLIVDNGTTGCSGFFGALLFGCVSDDNRCAGGSYFYRYSSVAVNTTFVRGALAGTQFYTDKDLHVYNSIISDFNSVDYFQLADAVGCVYDNSKINVNTDASKNTLTNGVRYVDKAGGDYRVLAGSPAIGAARMDGAEYLKYASTDYLNNPVCRGVAPSVAGAFIEPLTHGVVVVNDPKGLLLADGKSAAGNHRIPEGSSFVLSANTASTSRPVAGVTLNGVTNLFVGASGTVTVTAADVADTIVEVEPVLGDTWYVNAGDDAGWATGSDTNLGWGRWTPFRTVQKAVDKADTGDIILLAPGVYGEGTKTNGTECARVYVTGKSVTIRSEQGAAKTVVRGADAPEPDEYGCGEYATRCVKVENTSNSRLRLEGLTLSGGRAAKSTGFSSAASGAAVWSNEALSEEKAVLVDCVITNCRAYCSTVMGACIRRCRFVDCTSIKRGVLRYCLVYDTVFSQLTAKNTTSDIDQGRIWNMTWLPDNFKAYWSENAPCVNSLVYGRTSAAATNCVFTENLPTVQKDCRKIAADQWFLDAEGRPIVGQSPLVDAGWDGARALGEDALDASGRPRVSNGQIDIGALEADWNPTYSRRLGRGVTVTAASPSVVTNVSRGVSLGTNGALKFDWVCAADRNCEIQFNVTGTGTLTLAREGAEPVAYTAGDGQVYAFTAATDGVQRFTLTYEPGENDTGSAEILCAKQLVGMLLIVR